MSLFESIGTKEEELICLAEFCTCGSLVIGGRCTNKSCSNRTQDKQTSGKPAPAKKAKAEKAPAKAAKTKRASKCITYNLYEGQNEEGNNS